MLTIINTLSGLCLIGDNICGDGKVVREFLSRKGASVVDGRRLGDWWRFASGTRPCLMYAGARRLSSVFHGGFEADLAAHARCASGSAPRSTHDIQFLLIYFSVRAGDYRGILVLGADT